MAFGKTLCLALQVCLKNETLLQTKNNKWESKKNQIQRHGTFKKMDTTSEQEYLMFEKKLVL